MSLFDLQDLKFVCLIICIVNTLTKVDHKCYNQKSLNPLRFLMPLNPVSFSSSSFKINDPNKSEGLSTELCLQSNWNLTVNTKFNLMFAKVKHKMFKIFEPLTGGHYFLSNYDIVNK